jgi:hypothetical protein
MNPTAPVQRQFEAYNARDFEGFLACFSNSVRVYRMPSFEATLSGKVALGDFYARERFNRPALRAELLGRTALGNKVFDHERIWGEKDEPFELVVVFEVQGGLIETLWSFSA